MTTPPKNPYAAPEADSEYSTGAADGNYHLRSTHVVTEGRIQAIAALVMFAGAFRLLLMLAAVAEGLHNPRPRYVYDAVASLVTGSLALVAGRLLRVLKPSGRALLVAAFVLEIGAMFGTVYYKFSDESSFGASPVSYLLTPAVLIACLFLPRANRVLSSHYRLHALPATSHVQVPSGWPWLLLVILVCQLAARL